MTVLQVDDEEGLPNPPGVCPPSCCNRFLPEKLLIASGQEMGHYGQMKTKFGGGSDDMKTMSYEVTDVTKPLVAVRRTMDKGDEVHFGKEWCVRHVHPEERIPTIRKGQSYVIDIDAFIDEDPLTWRA